MIGAYIHGLSDGLSVHVRDANDEHNRIVLKLDGFDWYLSLEEATRLASALSFAVAKCASAPRPVVDRAVAGRVAAATVGK